MSNPRRALAVFLMIPALFATLLIFPSASFAEVACDEFIECNVDPDDPPPPDNPCDRKCLKAAEKVAKAEAKAAEKAAKAEAKAAKKAAKGR